MPLDAKPFDLLTYLIARRAEAVTRDEILTDVWPGRTVDPANVAVQLSALRSALKKAGATSNLIVTLPGPRYRFVGDVGTPASLADPVTVPPPLPPRASRRLGFVAAALLSAMLLAALLGTRALKPRQPGPRLWIVVMPFRYLGPDQSQNYVAENITEDLTSDLAHIPQSTVIARGSAEANRNKTPQEIGAVLNVRYLVDGSVTPDGPDFRIIANLIDTATGAHLCPPIDVAVRRTDVSAVRGEIIPQIASALHFMLDQLEASRSLHDRPDNPDAIDLFFQARAILDADDKAPAMRSAQSLLEEAIRMQDGFGDALAELGWLLLRKVQAVDDSTESDQDWIEANRIIADALHYAPRNSKALSAKAREMLIKGQYLDAVSTAEFVLLLEPSSIEAHWMLANCDWMLGQLDAEKSQLDTIARLDPDSLDNKHRYLMAGNVAIFSGDPKGAIDWLRLSITGDDDLGPGSDPMGRAQYARLLLVAAFELTGEHQKAAEAYQNYNAVRHYRSVWRFGEYFPKAIAVRQEAKNVLAALHRAGMPWYADGSISLIPSEVGCMGDDYSPTPNSIKGAKVLSDADMDRALGANVKPLVLDIGLGAGSVEQAEWFDPMQPETAQQFVDRVVAKRTGADKSAPIIVLGDGPFGCDAYNAAAHLVLAGYSGVRWYRGGEEGWVASGHAPKDRRPE